ncbi:MAG: MauE/DoxX family redox-associated membrane protein [Solirubrobacterales bacterium]
METILRVVLGIVLAGAALAKLASPRASIAAMAGFGFEGGPLRPIAWAGLIAIELGLGIAVALGSAPAAYLASGLMLLFAALTTGAILRGRAGAPCACFGPRSKVSWLGVLRNLALAAAFALVSLVDSIALTTDAWLGIAAGVALVACGCLTVAVLGLAREVGMLRLQLGTQGALEIAGEGPDVGSQAEALASRLAVPARNGTEQLGLAVFSSEGCHLCQTLSPAIENVANDPRVTVGVFDEVADAMLWSDLGIPGSPFAVATDEGGTVLAKGTFNNLAQLESVLATAVRRRA